MYTGKISTEFGSKASLWRRKLGLPPGRAGANPSSGTVGPPGGPAKATRMTLTADDPAAHTRGSGEVRSVARALDILAMFDDAHPSRSLAELAEGTALPKTTLLRLVGSLSQRHLLALRDGRYVLGTGFLRWVRLAHATWDVPAAVRARMRRLSDDTGETVNLYVRQGLSRIVLAQEESRATVRNVVEVGAEMPLAYGASGKILLAGEPRLVGSLPVESVPPGEHPAGDARSQLSDAVDAAARRGYAVSHGERELGSSGVAVPIRSHSGAVIAALALGGPTPRFTGDRVARHVTALQQAAVEIAHTGLPGVATETTRRDK